MPAKRIGRPPTPIAERFWALVDVGDGCWEWMGSRNNRRGGYGTFTDVADKKAKVYRAHRLAYELHYGPFDSRLLVLHACDNPPCVNPAHLRLGTQADNIADMMAKGRHGAKPKDFCQRGHAYAEHGRIYADGRKICVICTRDADLTKWYRRQGRERPPWSMSRDKKRQIREMAGDMAPHLDPRDCDDCRAADAHVTALVPAGAR